MNDLKRIDGPSCEPVSGMKPKQIVIFCHGLGSDGSDLIGLASYFSKTLPDAIFFSPNAPFPFDLAPIGHQWFSLENSSPASRIKGVRSAAPILDKFIDEKIRRINHHEKLVIDLNNKNFPIQKVDGFDDLTTISVDATLIDYQALENYFHETIRRKLPL